MTTENWHQVPWKEYYGTVFKMQEQIVMAYRRKNLKRVKELQRKLVNSKEGQFLAIRKVTTNQGSKTPGIDGTVLDTPLPHSLKGCNPFRVTSTKGRSAISPQGDYQSSSSV
jgi:retron-type reverse transcriptase